MNHQKTLLDIVRRDLTPAPWSEGDNIPWNEPGFSERMLKEHLTQDHDLASRRLKKIDQHVSWIHQEALSGQPGKLLDLGCGPGLYASRLTSLGHQVTGIDYAPASIAYAQKQAVEAGQTITYLHADIREAHYGTNYDAAIQIFGEVNVFKPADLHKILRKIYAALKPCGKLVIEPHTFEIVQKMGESGASWFTSESGLFSPVPHLVLTENFWDDEQHAATIRHFVVEAATGAMIRYAQSLQAYTNEEYTHLLTETGFTNICFYPSLLGDADPDQEHLIAITAEKP
jgi:SAM-dependent methyltransferase